MRLPFLPPCRAIRLNSGRNSVASNSEGRGMNTRKLIGLAILLLCPSLVSAQSFFRIQGTVQTPLGAAVPGASVAICTQPAVITTQPCTPLASVYAGPNSNTATITNATYAAQQITFTFASVPGDVTPGTYITVSGITPTGYNGIWLVFSVSGSHVVIANVFTNPGTYTSGGSVATSVLPNPLTTDGNGFFYGYVARAAYTVQEFGSNIVTQVYLDQYPNGGSGGGGGVSPVGSLTGQFANAGATALGNATCPLGTFSVDSVTSTTYISDPCNTFFASGIPYYDVCSPVYGGKCDGVTDDTAAVQSVVNAMCANVTGNSNPGVVYFSRSNNPEKFNGNVFSSCTSINSKYVLSDNSFLLTGSVTFAVNAQNWTFIQRVGAPQGLTPVSNWASYGTWATTGNFPALDLGEPAYGLWFEGINFIGDINAGATASPVHLHDNCTGGVNVPAGCGAGAFITFSKCHFLPATANQVPLLIDSSNSAVGSWYSVKVDNSTFQTQGTQPYALKFINAGQLYMRDSNFAGTGAILAQNNGVGIAGQLILENISSENMIAATNPDFLTVSDGGGANFEGEFSIRNLNIQDPTGSIYVFKAIDTASGDVKNVSVEICRDGQCGAGIIDPASSVFVGFRCQGNGGSNTGCSATVAANKSNVADMVLIPGDSNGFYSYTSNYHPAITS